MTVLDLRIGLPGHGTMLQFSDSKLSPVSKPLLQREEDGGARNVRCRILCPPLQDFEQELHSVQSFQMQLAKNNQKIIFLIERTEPISKLIIQVRLKFYLSRTCMM